MARCDPCVLVVEDDRYLREALADIIDNAGYTVRTAATGQEALALAAEHPPGFVLLDLKLPVMSGQEALAALRQLPGHIPVIFMSSRQRAKEAAGHEDVEGYLEKPFEVEELLRLLERFCG